MRMNKLDMQQSLKNLIPAKGDGKREIARKISVLVLIAALIFTLCFLIAYFADSASNKNQNAKLQQQHKVSSKISSSDNGGILPELVSSYNQNKELSGWISIPKTNIDYPVVQCKSDNKNEKYLKTSFNGQQERHGTIFLDFRDNINPLSQDMILYGHNMNDDQMFSELEKYAKARGNDYVGFYNSSPIIKFDTLYKHYKWKIFAVFATTGDDKYEGSLYYLNTQYGSDNEFNKFIGDVRKRSFINTQVDVTTADRILTLSTCNYDYPKTDNDWARLVVMARLVRDGESTDVAPATANSNVVFPKVWKIK